MNLDFLKVIVVLIALALLNFKIRPSLSSLNFFIMNLGLFLLLFAASLDFTDGIKELDYLPVLGKQAAYHDLLEDQFGDTAGLALFIFAAFREIITRQK
ncbi:MAG: hypothetical protein AB1629_07960 [Candidatus Omnitrophota bacterium]